MSWKFIHLAVCLKTSPKLFQSELSTLRSRASSFKWEYPLHSFRSSSSFLRLLPRLSVTSIRPSIFPSISRCRRQFLRKMWPIQLAFRLLISCRIFLCSLALSNTSSFLTCLKVSRINFKETFNEMEGECRLWYYRGPLRSVTHAWLNIRYKNTV